MSNPQVIIDKEFKSLIPPLAPEELELFNKNRLGFEGGPPDAESARSLTLIPTPIGSLWWLWIDRDLGSGTETFSRRPSSISRMPLEKWRGFKMRAIPMEPSWGYPGEAKPTEDRLTNVYFIQSIIGGPVKIGKADFPKDRLATFQIGSPFGLRIVKLLENVPASVESKFHNRFAAHRLHGEWFSEKVLKLL